MSLERRQRHWAWKATLPRNSWQSPQLQHPGKNMAGVFFLGLHHNSCLYINRQRSAVWQVGFRQGKLTPCYNGRRVLASPDRLILDLESTEFDCQ